MKKILLMLTLTSGLIAGFCSTTTAGLNDTYKELQSALFPTDDKSSALSLKEGVSKIIEASKKKDIQPTKLSSKDNAPSDMSGLWTKISSWVGATISSAKENWNYYFFKQRALKYWLDFAIVQEAFDRIEVEKNKKSNVNKEDLEKSIDSFSEKKQNLTLRFTTCPDFSKTSMYQKFQLVVEGLVANDGFIQALTDLKIDKNPANFIKDYCANSTIINAFIMKTAAYEKQKLDEDELLKKDKKIEETSIEKLSKESKKYESKENEGNSYAQKVYSFFSNLWGKTDTTTDEL